MNRPTLDQNLSFKQFKDYYWLKKELVDFCRATGINCSGGKLEIAARIEVYLEKGAIIEGSGSSKRESTSTFDWKKESLSSKTIITDNYKNTENVRLFFENEIGSHFKFNVDFMNWMKANHGKTLEEAVDQWNEISTLKKNKNYKSEIAPQFEYNTYMRDFLADNPELSSKDAIQCWKVKRSMPGSNRYERSDLQFSNRNVDIG